MVGGRTSEAPCHVMRRRQSESERERAWPGAQICHSIQLSQINDLPETSPVSLAWFVLLPAGSLHFPPLLAQHPHPIFLFHLSIISCPSTFIHPVHLSMSSPPFSLFFLHSCHKSNLCNVESLLFHYAYTIDPAPVSLFVSQQQQRLQSQSSKCPHVGNTLFHLETLILLSITITYILFMLTWQRFTIGLIITNNEKAAFCPFTAVYTKWISMIKIPIW